MTTFIYQIDKEENEKSIDILLYFIDTKEKTTNLAKHSNPYSLLIKKSDFEKLNIKNDKILLATEDFRDKNEQIVTKLVANSKDMYNYITLQAKENNLDIYEADLPLEHAYIIGKNIHLLNNGQSIKEKGQKKTKDENFSLKTLSIDIETIGNMNSQEIIMISTHSFDSKTMNKVYINKSKLQVDKIKKITLDKEYKVVLLKNEKEMIKQFRDDIIEFSPQAIIGWNFIDFDMKVIRERMKVFDLEFKFSKFKGDCKLRINTDFFKDSSMHIPGILVFDIIQLLKSNYIVFEDYKLNTVAKDVLSDQKIDITESEDEDDNLDDKMLAIENMLKNNPNKLIEYNYKDSLLTSQIVKKMNLIRLMIERSIITGAPLSKVKSPIASLDIMYLKKLHKKGYVAPSNFNFTDSGQIEGAYVIEPQRGFYNDIFVFDFKSLYPSIIMTFNIDPFTHDKNGEIEAPNGAKFKKNKGILPELIFKLYKERDKAKKNNDRIKSNALKITMNSFWGAIASPKSRFYNSEIGGAITAFARFIIQKAQKFIENKGFNVVYGDTDSIFVEFSDKQFKNLEDKKKFGESVEKEINDFFGEWVKKEFKLQSFLNIEFEKLYSNFFIASKKRYVGYDEFTNSTQFVGMEAIRGDWTLLAKNFQVELINLIFSGKDKEKIEKYILSYIDDLKKGKFDNLLVYKKKITKPLKYYTKTTPPHVKAAREIENFKGRTVKYVMSEKGPKHISLVDKKIVYDYIHYINKQLKGVSDDILESLGIDFDEVLRKRKQKSLDRFF